MMQTFLPAKVSDIKVYNINQDDIVVIVKNFFLYYPHCHIYAQLQRNYDAKYFCIIIVCCLKKKYFICRGK